MIKYHGYISKWATQNQKTETYKYDLCFMCAVKAVNAGYLVEQDTQGAYKEIECASCLGVIEIEEVV